MIVWLWDACGPERSGRGVTDDEARAIQRAEMLMRSGQANVAKVESARADLGIRTLTSGYRRTGQGWHARCGDSGIRWEPLAPAGGRAAS
jgi:hypothetical protein